MIITIDPKNIQAILAVQFKEFGLGEGRNGNFNPLLGHGIVSIRHHHTARDMLLMLMPA
jgi:hypothetical protein